MTRGSLGQSRLPELLVIPDELFPWNGCVARMVGTFIEDGIVQAIPKLSSRHYFAIFILASATLSYQILITRFFSVVLYYHFAFAAISLAMLGLTRGAMKVYGNPDRYASERVGVEFARHASWFAMSGVGAMIAFLLTDALCGICARSTASTA